MFYVTNIMLSKNVLKNIKSKVNDIILNIKDSIFCVKGCFNDNNVEIFNECYSDIKEDMNTLKNIVKINKLIFLNTDLRIISIKMIRIKKMFFSNNGNINKDMLNKIFMSLIWYISLFESSFNNYGWYNITDRGEF